MNKKVWSVILLCVLTALFIFLCIAGIEVQEVMDAFNDSVLSDENASGISFFAGILGIFSIWASLMISSFLISCGGIVLSVLNIRIAPNKVMKYFSIGFLILYSIPLLVIAISLLGSLLLF